MHLKSLTSLRFFAALMVAFSHLELLERSASVFVRELSARVFHEGYIGVTFFFILSGFILSFSYSARLKSGRVDLTDFWIARFARIVPLHLLTLVVALPFSLWLLNQDGIQLFFVQLLANVSLTHAFIPMREVFFSLNAPSWSLSVEMLFYLSFPFLISAPSKRLVVLMAAVLLFQQAIIWMQSAGVVHYLVYIFPPSRLADFIAGLLLFRLFQRLPQVSTETATAAQGFALTTLVAAFWNHADVAQGLRFDIYYLVPMALIVLSFAWQNGVLAKLISGRLLVFLGEASFAMYLVHQLVIRFGEYVRLRLLAATGTQNEVLFAAAYIVISIAVGAFLYFKFERTSKKLVLKAASEWRARLALLPA